jgi:peptidylprolyl isomerase
MKAQKGDRVIVAYTGKQSNGQVFDRSPDDRPLEFVVGEGKLIPGFENAVEGMAVAEEKTVTIPAAQAYGQRDPALVRKFNKEVLTGTVTLKKGMTVRLRLQNGGSILGTVLDLPEDGVIIDINHPLAGQDLSFAIKLLSVQPSVPEKPKA